MNRKFIATTIFSLAWFGIFAVLLFLKRDTMRTLSLNEWGDLISGFAAPLALIWVIFGYLLQGEELRLNTHALEAQQREFELNTEALKGQQIELQNQVAATTLLAESTARFANATEDQLKELQRNTDVLQGQQEELKKQAQAASSLAESTARFAASLETQLALQQLGAAGKVIKFISDQK